MAGSVPANSLLRSLPASSPLCMVPAVLALLCTLVSPLAAQEETAAEKETASRSPSRQEALEAIFPGLSLPGQYRDAFLRVPRRPFLPEELAPFAEENRSLPLTGDAVLPSHSLALTLVRIAEPDRESRVLVAGTGGGYLATLLRAAGAEVTLAETDMQQAEHYRSAWQDLAVSGIELVELESFGALEGREEYSAVIVHGYLREAPQELFALLDEGGVLAAPLSDGEGGRLLTVYRNTPQPSLEAIAADLFPAPPLQLP